MNEYQINKQKREQENIERNREYQFEPMFELIRNRGVEEAIDYFRASDITSGEPFNNLQENVDRAFILCAAARPVQGLKFLMTSPQTEVKPDINKLAIESIINAGYFGNLENIKYILESPSLDRQKVIYANNNMDSVIENLVKSVFNATASSDKYIDIIEYLVKEIHILPSEKVVSNLSHFKTYSNENNATFKMANRLIELLDMNLLHDKLQKSTYSKQEKKKSQKI